MGVEATVTISIGSPYNMVKYLDIYFCTFLLSHSQQYQWDALAQNMREFLSRYLDESSFTSVRANENHNNTVSIGDPSETAGAGEYITPSGRTMTLARRTPWYRRY